MPTLHSALTPLARTTVRWSGSDCAFHVLQLLSAEANEGVEEVLGVLHRRAFWGRGQFRRTKRGNMQQRLQYCPIWYLRIGNVLAIYITSLACA
jgi:hypothetical protein